MRPPADANRSRTAASRPQRAEAAANDHPGLRVRP